MKFIFLKFIKIYQKTISPDHGIFFHNSVYKCRFYPSCSQYSYEAVENYGFLKGLGVALKRILRCNPFNKGGYDPLVVFDGKNLIATKNNKIIV